MGNKPWQTWKTRKVVLVSTIAVVLTYVTIGLVMGWLGKELDSTLTDNFFDFCKWTVITGSAITIAKVGKGRTNSDNDEPDVECDDNANIPENEEEI